MSSHDYTVCHKYHVSFVCLPQTVFAKVLSMTSSSTPILVVIPPSLLCCRSVMARSRILQSPPYGLLNWHLPIVVVLPRCRRMGRYASSMEVRQSRRSILAVAPVRATSSTMHHSRLVRGTFPRVTDHITWSWMTNVIFMSLIPRALLLGRACMTMW